MVARRRASMQLCPCADDRATAPLRRGRPAMPGIDSAIAPTRGLGLVGELRHQRRQIGRHNGPHDVVVDIVLPVNEPVPQSHDGRPRVSGRRARSSTETRGGGLANDLEQADDRQGQHTIGIQVPARPTVHQRQQLARVIAHLAKAHRRIMPRHTGPAPRPAPRRGSSDSATRAYGDRRPVRTSG